jgi:DNA-binding NtrC family response regulator
VMTAECGEEAVKTFHEHGDAIGLVIMDLIMPGMGGVKAIKVLREVNPDLRCIISSGCGTDTCEEFGDDPLIRYVGKPYQASTLMKGVRELMNDGGAQ